MYPCDGAKGELATPLEKLHLLGRSHGKFRASAINSELLLLKPFPKLPTLSNLAAFRVFLKLL